MSGSVMDNVARRVAAEAGPGADGPGAARATGSSWASSALTSVREVECVTAAWHDEAVDPESPLSWQERALCAQTDPEAFFPEKGGSTREAKRVCTGCEVRGECLEYALAHDERFGIWGGLSERERRRLKRRVI